VLLVTLSTLVIIAVVVAAAVQMSSWQLKQPRDHPRTSPTTVLQHHSVEDMIERNGGYTDVICNNGVDPVIQVDLTFTCIADGGLRINVIIVNDNGEYVWTPAS
jgi:hypothetical protein